MPEKKHILIQLDHDKHPSVFDRVVAIDAGADEVFAYGPVDVDDVTALVHGAIFTRGGEDLRRTAIFIGGSDVARGEAMLARVQAAFFGPMRVSVMLDANGANTTAAAAVVAASRHLPLASASALVLGGTGPVGQRAARMLAREGASVLLASRSEQRAEAAAAAIDEALGESRVTGCAIGNEAQLIDALRGMQIVIAAGAAGVQLLPAHVRQQAPDLRVAIDLNAVPPAGIEGVRVTDKAELRQQVHCYGAIGVGGMKMKIHKAAIASLFDRNDHVLDADEIYALAKQLLAE